MKKGDYASELEVLRQSPTYRALLEDLQKQSPGQVKRLAEYMEEQDHARAQPENKTDPSRDT
jgi:hypothetical protein